MWRLFIPFALLLIPVAVLGGPVADYVCELPVDMYYEGSSAVRVVCRRPVFTLACDQANAGLGGRSLSCRQYDAAAATVRTLSVRMEGFRVYNAVERSMHGSLIRWWHAALGTVWTVVSESLQAGRAIFVGLGAWWTDLETPWKE